MVQRNLAATTTKISARSLEDEVEDDGDQTVAAKAAPTMAINMQEFMKS